MEKHTPGPWYKGQIRANGFIDIRSMDQRTICEVLPQLPTETEANAHLIAAAPELLEACRMALAAMRQARDDWGDGYQPDGAWCNAWDALRQAIAKAEGRTTDGQA